MAKKEKNIVESKWEALKAESKSDNPNIQTIDMLSCDLLANLAEMSIRGMEMAGETPIDLMKDRVWWVIEKHGLLPEYKDEDDLLVDDLDIEDDFYQTDDEFDVEIDDSKFYR